MSDQAHKTLTRNTHTQQHNKVNAREKRRLEFSETPREHTFPQTHAHSRTIAHTYMCTRKHTHTQTPRAVVDIIWHLCNTPLAADDFSADIM